MENMTRGRGWRFLDLGRRLERGVSMLKLLQAAATFPSQPAMVLEPVLEIADSVMTYRRLFYDRPSWPGVLAVLVRDESNPRSVAFQFHVLREHMAALEAGVGQFTPAPERSLLTDIMKDMAALDSAGHAAQSPSPAVRELFKQWAAVLASLSDQVSNRYFSHSVPRIS